MSSDQDAAGLELRLLKTIDSHPTARALRSRLPDVQLERSVLPIPPADVADNLTVGTLGPGTSGCTVSPAVLVSRDATDAYVLLAAFHIGRGLTGHRGYAHGGAIATILDECCGRACLSLFQAQSAAQESAGPPKQSAAVTAQLSISFMAPVQIGSIAVVEATVDLDASKGRKAYAVVKLWTTREDRTPETLAAEARGLFIDPSTASN